MASTLTDFPRLAESPLAGIPSEEGARPIEPHLLLAAFTSFNEASASLQAAFQKLQARVRCLSEELEAKNRELECSLRDKEEIQNYLNTILASLPCGVLVLDEDHRVVLSNPMASKLLDEPDAMPMCLDRSGRVLKAGIIRSHFEGCTDESLREIEIPYLSRGGLRFLVTSGTPLKDSSGRPSGKVHIIRDITEVKALQEQSKRGERLAAMGEMAVELAHEIRNPLGGIELFASLLEKELPAGEESGRWAANIRIGSRSLNNIVSNMLQFARPLSPDFSEVDLHQAIEEILGFTDLLTRQREVQVEMRLNAAWPMICCDPELIKQMLLNLILNAMQAMPSRGSLTIATRNIERLPDGVRCRGLELTIRDTGVGIPAENLSRIFDPFYTTNKRGTGLGLAVVHQIIDRHSGFISVQSEESKGTTFTIAFPAAHSVSGAA